MNQGNKVPSGEDRLQAFFMGYKSFSQNDVTKLIEHLRDQLHSNQQEVAESVDYIFDLARDRQSTHPEIAQAVVAFGIISCPDFETHVRLQYGASAIGLQRLITEGEQHVQAFVCGQPLFRSDLVPVHQHAPPNVAHPTFLQFAMTLGDIYLFGCTIGQKLSFREEVKHFRQLLEYAKQPRTQALVCR